MRRQFLTPIAWGFFLSVVAFASTTEPQLRLHATQRQNLQMPDRSDAVKTLHVLAIRVEFQRDTLSTTTGDGTFGSGVPSDVVVDPLPHDRFYFEDHITFLQNYFAEVSNGQIEIADDFKVYPTHPDSVYRLPHQMWHYNYNSGSQTALDQSLAELFVDAWTAAGQDPTLDPTGYDLFVIYHAGVGQDFDVGIEETPHDIPSAYFRLSDLQDALGDPGYQGVSVGNSFITGGLLLPETEHQYEAEDIEIALNGTSVLLLGHWLGLPALYNTDDGTSGVGRFDFMDQGSGNFAGMVPARPCAWTQTFMGWADPVQIHPTATQDTFYVQLVDSDSAHHEIYRIDLNESEYLLIENRTGDRDEIGYTIARDSQNRRLKIYDDFNIELMDGDFGVIVEVDNYDFGLAALQDGPGEGILIWHINDAVIEEKYATNNINTKRSRRGVYLLEGDGADDIGRFYGILETQDLGWWGDFFFGGNQPFLDSNPELSSVRIFDDSHPSTRAADGSATGLNIGGFSERDEVMRFWVSNGWARSGFPQRLADASAQFSPSSIDFNGDGQTDWILTFTPNGAVQAFDTLAAPQGFLCETQQDTNLLGETITLYDTLLARVTGIASTPAIDVYDNGFTAYFAGPEKVFYRLAYDHLAYAVSLDSVLLDGSGSATPLMTGSGDERIIYFAYDSGVIALSDSLIVLDQFSGFDEGEVVGLCLTDTVAGAPVFALSDNGQGALFDIWSDEWTVDIPFTPAYPPLTLLHHPNHGVHHIAVVSAQGDIALIDADNGQIAGGFPVNVGMNVTAAPAAGDFDRDGYLEVVLLGENRITAVQVNGSLAAGWPYRIDNRRLVEAITSPPAISELDGDLRVIFGWPDGAVDARNKFSIAPRGFPLSTGNTIKGTPLVVQMDPPSDDDEAELIVLDESGYLYAWNLEQMGFFNQQRHPWNGFQGGNKRQGIAVDPVDLAGQSSKLLNIQKVYPWPNPAKDVVHIRYKMGQSGLITARIFDGAGDLVKELSRSAAAGLEGDLIWNLADVSSGVYIARVEAESGGSTEKAFIKIAVLK